MGGNRVVDHEDAHAEEQHQQRDDHIEDVLCHYLFALKHADVGDKLRVSNFECKVFQLPLQIDPLGIAGTAFDFISKLL